MAPKWLKMAPKRPQDGLPGPPKSRSHFDAMHILLQHSLGQSRGSYKVTLKPCWTRHGSNLGSFGGMWGGLGPTGVHLESILASGSANLVASPGPPRDAQQLGYQLPVVSELAGLILRAFWCLKGELLEASGGLCVRTQMAQLGSSETRTQATPMHGSDADSSRLRKSPLVEPPPSRQTQDGPRWPRDGPKMASIWPSGTPKSHSQFDAMHILWTC